VSSVVGSNPAQWPRHFMINEEFPEEKRKEKKVFFNVSSYPGLV
jgi:hypothetical protein